jgi:serine/threonine protein kinase
MGEVQTLNPKFQTLNLYFQVGTPCYLAPEVMSNELYGEAADIWGLGCIGLEMLSLNFLWEMKGLMSVKVRPETRNPKFSAREMKGSMSAGSKPRNRNSNYLSVFSWSGTI